MSARLPVTLLDGSEDQPMNNVKISALSSVILFLNYWNGVLGETKASDTPDFKPLLVTNQ